MKMNLTYENGVLKLQDDSGEVAVAQVSDDPYFHKTLETRNLDVVMKDNEAHLLTAMAELAERLQRRDLLLKALENKT